MKLGLYSITYLGIWYRGAALTLPELIKTAKRFGYDGIEIDGECARYAGEAGVILALQNHRPVIKDYPDVLRMVSEVNSPHLKVCLDAPLMVDKGAKAMREAAQAVGPL